MAAINIEFCCTGNQCRSVMAEAFARRGLAERGIDATVSSSGLLEAGHPAPDDVVAVMARRGIDVVDHRSRTIEAEVIAAASLVIGMERRHLTEIITIDPDAWTRSFTLVEFVRRVDALGLEATDDHSLDAVLAGIAETRTRRDLLRVGVDDEIPDPIGRSPKVFERTAEEIDSLVDRLVAGLWPSVESASAGVP